MLIGGSTDNCQTHGRTHGVLYTGGFAGYVDGLTANDCYALGDVESSSYNVGGLVGYSKGVTSLIKCGAISNITSGGKDSTNHSYIGGGVGNATDSVVVNNCFAVGDISAAGTHAGGISGGGHLTVTNSYYSGKITGTDYIGGIVGGGGYNCTLKYNYANGSLMGNKYVGGIAGWVNNGSDISSCVATQDVINAVSGVIGRIYGAKGSTATVGTTGANRAMTTMSVVSEGKQLTVEDGDQHGTSLGKGLLKYKSSYQGIGWDFSTDWTILETESFPYKPSQCSPPVILGALTSGGTTISGKCAEGTSIHVIVGNTVYDATVSGTTWNVTVPAMQSGATVKAYATADEFIQSYYVTATVSYTGSGTEEDPFLIYTASDLANINSYSYYKVMNDIDVTDWIATNSPDAGWLPIGQNTGGTMRQLDGNGKTVSGLWFNTTASNAGMLSTIENATIKDLTVKTTSAGVASSGNNVAIVVGKSSGSTFINVNVEGLVNGKSYTAGVTGYSEDCTFNGCKSSNVTVNATSYAGGIAGTAIGGTIENCRVMESTIAATGDYVGGLVGETTAAIDNCSVDVTLTGGDYLGGITGNSTGNITLCHAEGDITTTALTTCRAGGIVGYITGDIANCYSEANTTGGQYAGGIAGYSFGKIDNCYSSGDLYATNFGGGIVGYLDGTAAEVNNCFAINNKIDVSDQNGIAMRVIGGFRNGAPTPQANNYALKSMVVSVNDVTQRIYDDLLHGISLENSALMAAATYTAQGWDFTDTWGINEGQGYPYLQALVETEDPGDFMPGDVNGDGTINVSDYIATARYILEQDPQPFILAAADFDGNGDVTVGDLIRVANLVLTYEGAPRQYAPANYEPGNVAMNASVTAIGDNRYEVAVTLDNDVDLTAMQLDLRLPAGMTMTGATLSSRATRSHELNYTERADGSYRMLAASGALKAFSGSEGTVLTLTLEGNAGGIATISGIELATPRAESYRLDDITLDFMTTGIANVDGQSRVYREGNHIVIVSPVVGKAQLVLPNGRYTTVTVKPGRNVYNAPSDGIVIVKTNNNAVKLKF